QNRYRGAGGLESLLECIGRIGFYTVATQAICNLSQSLQRLRVSVQDQQQVVGANRRIHAGIILLGAIHREFGICDGGESGGDVVMDGSWVRNGPFVGVPSNLLAEMSQLRIASGSCCCLPNLFTAFMKQ